MAAPSTPPRRPAKRDTSSLMPLRPKDPAIERALQLSTFESNYSTEDFITTLSSNLIADSKSTPGPFDPKPFIQTFSPALDTLLSLRSQMAERTKKMESDVRRAEREYGKRLRELDGGFEAIGTSFSNLENKITDVARSAVRIGEQLESLHQTRSTAQSTSLLLSYYLSLVHQTSTTPDPSNPAAQPATPLETLFATRTSRDGRARLAVILRRLMAVAKDVADNASAAVAEAETPKAGQAEAVGGGKAVGKKRTEKEKAERVRDEIERYCERFEKEVLRLFDRSYRKGDPRMMAHCAKTLQDFNGGASCVQIYVNQHDFFISKDRVLEEAEKQDTVDGEDGPSKRIDIWKTIGDPDAAPPTNEPGMEALFKEIRITVSQEAQIVKAVFPNPLAVMQVFLQRVFAQVIQQHLETLVDRAQSISTLAVLRVLNLTHSLCTALVEDLKSYDAVLAGPGGPSSSKAASGGGTGPLAAMLDHALEEMFVPWLEGSRYLESETKNLVELYAGLLSRFTRYHETVLKAKPNSLMDKVVHQLSSTSSSATTSSAAQAAAAAISKYANVFTSGVGASSSVSTASALKSPQTATKALVSPTTGKPPMSLASGAGMERTGSVRGAASNAEGKEGEERVWETDGVLTVEGAERMLRWHAEAVGRVMELSATSDVGRNAFALSKTLAEAIGRSFIETALDSALARLDQQDPRNEPSLQPLAVLKPADLICHLWQRYASTAVLPLAGSAVSLRREMTSFMAHGVVRMEGKVDAVIQKALDLIMGYLTHVLSRQKKNDYKPKDEVLSFARNNTEPCDMACEFLERLLAQSRDALSGKNLEAFLLEVGVGFHSLLLDHYKKFPVSPTGGLMLTKDLALYQDTISHFALAQLNDRFDMLRQLGNSFIVQPNVLKSYMTESHLGRIDARLLRPYLAQRSDYSQFSRSLNLDDGPPSATTEHEHGSVIGLFSRHSGGGGGGGGGGGSNRLSVMSGVAGAGMGKLREMLKEFETYTPEEVSRMNQKAREAAERNEKMGVGRYAAAPMPLYFH